MGKLLDRLAEWRGEMIVLDFRSPFLAIGVLVEIGEDFLELEEADMHDLRDTETTRELYLVKTARHGVAANRRSLVVRLDEVVGVSRLSDVATG